MKEIPVFFEKPVKTEQKDEWQLFDEFQQQIENEVS